MIEQHAPSNYNGQDPENILNRQDKSFERVCISMEDNGVSNPKNLTEYEFYSRISYLEEKFNKDKHGNQISVEE